MLVEQTLEKLNSMRLLGMAAFLRTWLADPKQRDIGPSILIGLLADAKRIHRENARLTQRLRNASLSCRRALRTSTTRHTRTREVDDPGTADLTLDSAEPEHRHHRPDRSRQELPGLCSRAESLPRRIPPLPTAACRVSSTASRRLAPMARCRCSCGGSRRRTSSSSTILGLEVLGVAERKGPAGGARRSVRTSSTIVTSQLAPDAWHAVIGDHRLTRSLDRPVHNAHRMSLKGDSIRRAKSTLTSPPSRCFTQCPASLRSGCPLPGTGDRHGPERVIAFGPERLLERPESPPFRPAAPRSPCSAAATSVARPVGELTSVDNAGWSN